VTTAERSVITVFVSSGEIANVGVKPSSAVSFASYTVHVAINVSPAVSGFGVSEVTT